MCHFSNRNISPDDIIHQCDMVKDSAANFVFALCFFSPIRTNGKLITMMRPTFLPVAVAIVGIFGVSSFVLPVNAQGTCTYCAPPWEHKRACCTANQTCCGKFTCCSASQYCSADTLCISPTQIPTAAPGGNYPEGTFLWAAGIFQGFPNPTVYNAAPSGPYSDAIFVVGYNVSVLNASSGGAMMWSIANPVDMFTSALVAFNHNLGHVILSTGAGLQARDIRTGRLVWQTTAPATMPLPVTTYHLPNGKAVIIAQYSNAVQCFEAATGKAMWTSVNASVVYSGSGSLDIFVLLSWSGDALLGVRMSTGEIAWRRELPYDEYIASDLTVTLSDDKSVLLVFLLMANTGGGFTAGVDSRSGDVLWNVTTAIPQQVDNTFRWFYAVGYNFVIASTNFSSVLDVRAYYGKTGKLMWHKSWSGDSVLGVVGNALLTYADTAGIMTAVSTMDARRLWHIAAPAPNDNGVVAMTKSDGPTASRRRFAWASGATLIVSDATTGAQLSSFTTQGTCTGPILQGAGNQTVTACNDYFTYSVEL